jgi:hypothetical protein
MSSKRGRPKTGSGPNIGLRLYPYLDAALACPGGRRRHLDREAAGPEAVKAGGDPADT